MQAFRTTSGNSMIQGPVDSQRLQFPGVDESESLEAMWGPAFPPAGKTKKLRQKLYGTLLTGGGGGGWWVVGDE